MFLYVGSLFSNAYSRILTGKSVNSEAYPMPRSLCASVHNNGENAALSTFLHFSASPEFLTAIASSHSLQDVRVSE